MKKNLMSELTRITNNQLKERHSYFQLQYFLIGKEPTVQAKLWRCVQELKTRKETLEAINLEIEDTEDDILLLNFKNLNELNLFGIDSGNKEEIEIKQRKNERKKKKLTHKIENLRNRLKNVEEEINFIIVCYQSLEKIEVIKDYDDIESQKKYWNEKLSQEFNLRTLFGMPLDLELIKTILALNSDSPIKMDTLNIMDSIQGKIEKKELERLMKITNCDHELEKSIIQKEKDGI